MRSYTAADFCQGHGGGRECSYSPEADGCLQHGDDFDHGVISYCDGSCPEGREHHLRYQLSMGQPPLVTTMAIALEVYGNGVSYTVTFEGRHAEARALAYMAGRRDLSFSVVEDRPFSYNAFPKIMEALYPVCHHGMSLALCMDPYGEAHFGTREQELAGQ